MASGSSGAEGGVAAVHQIEAGGGEFGFVEEEEELGRAVVELFIGVGPAHGAVGGEGQNRLGLVAAHIFEGFVVDRCGIAHDADLERHMALLAALGIDVALGFTLGIAALQHVEILGSGEGQIVVELALH